MKRYYFIGLIVFLANNTKVRAQLIKPVVDSAAFDHWSSLISYGDLTNDGRYASYVLREEEKQITVIKSLTSDWQKKLLSVNGLKFLSNSKRAIYQSGDSLCFMELGTDKISFVAGVQSFELVSKNNNEWLLCKIKDDSGAISLNIINTVTTDKVSINHISNYYFFENSSSLLIIQPEMQGEKMLSNTLRWYNLISNRSSNAFVITGTMPALVICRATDQFCYAKEDTSGHCTALMFYKRGMAEPDTIVDNRSIAKSDTNLVLSDWSNASPEFTKDGCHIAFTVKTKNMATLPQHVSKVTLWRYNDWLLPTEQRQGVSVRNEFRWLLSLIDSKLIPLENLEYGLTSNPADCKNYLLCRKLKSFLSTFWRKEAVNSFSVMDLNRSKQVMIDDKVRHSATYYLSPEEKYVVHYDPILKNYFCFNLASKQTRNLTLDLKQQWSVKINENSVSYAVKNPIAGWLPNDEAVLICADYDIWKLDPAGIKSPVNITNGFGERHHIRFRIATQLEQSYEKSLINGNQDLLLYAFDSATKKSGFYRKKMNDNCDPVLLNMDAVSYILHSGDNLTLQKAKNANKWIIIRESAAASPNLFTTTDFKDFLPLSDIHPEKNYNWPTSELITWQLPDGQYSQGILYKPDDFDLNKKYPVIFEYYEECSDELNQFIAPRYSIDKINIPYFVSHGYLVFVPDIHYTIANVGESALNSVFSAAKHLSKYSWVDSTKMGLKGHSFGGGETNYIVTHCQFFAAACESAGPADAISSFGSLNGYGPNMYTWSKNSLFETGQQRMRASLAEIPEAYIKGSPVLNTADVTTPLLMMHNQNDGNVPWSQGVEFFTGLKRMGKRVWMLEYAGGGHSVFGEQAKDYTIRMQQFFDHYLKGAPLPKWMLENGDLSYELDSSAKEPEPREVLYKGIYQKVLPVN